MPTNASDALRRLIETLFITHTEAQLNTDGHLDRLLFPNATVNPHNSTQQQQQQPENLWYKNLVRNPFVHQI